MVYTITFNPSIDQHIIIDRLVKDDAIRAKDISREPGGKGINVSRVVKELGGQTKAFAIIGGCAGYMMRDLLDRNRIDFGVIEIIGETRINVIVTDLSDRTQTRISMAGPCIGIENIRDFIKLIDEAKPAPSFWVLGGSLPPGAPKDTYKRIIKHLREKGQRCILDADGDALRLGIEGVPYLIKPNEFEFERLLNKPITSDNNIIEASKELCSRGIEIVIVSLGARGAIIVTKEEAFKFESPKVEVRSKVGAGDSLIGGLLVALERGLSLKEAGRYAVAAGTAAVITEGTKLCLRKDVERLIDAVKIQSLSLKDKFQVKDIVCGMYIEKAKASAKSSYRNKDYYFCSLACKQRFDSQREKFIKREYGK
jgi:1-phosphofructokinase family hexose kinase